MSDLFADVAYPRMKAAENVYSNDPDDAGGETVWGIARTRNPHWEGWALVDELREQHPDHDEFVRALEESAEVDQAACEFYRTEYWQKMGCHEMPPALALEVFDCGMNCGMSTAVGFLQRSLNVFNKRTELYPDVCVDGNWGSRSHGALEGYIGQRGDLDVLIVCFSCLRGAYYVQITEKDQTKEKYVFGWMSKRIHVRPLD